METNKLLGLILSVGAISIILVSLFYALDIAFDEDFPEERTVDCFDRDNNKINGVTCISSSWQDLANHTTGMFFGGIILFAAFMIFKCMGPEDYSRPW